MASRPRRAGAEVNMDTDALERSLKSAVAFLATFAATLLLIALASDAIAADLWYRDVLVTFRETPASILECSAKSVTHGSASAIMAPACTEPQEFVATVILPSGAPDWLVSHEAWHIWAGDYHSALFWFVDK